MFFALFQYLRNAVLKSHAKINICKKYLRKFLKLLTSKLKEFGINAYRHIQIVSQEFYCLLYLFLHKNPYTLACLRSHFCCEFKRRILILFVVGNFFIYESAEWIKYLCRKCGCFSNIDRHFEVSENMCMCSYICMYVCMYVVNKVYCCFKHSCRNFSQSVGEKSQPRF